MQRVLALEVYDKFPEHSAEHGGIQEHRRERSRHRKECEPAPPVERALGDAKAQPWEMWSFHGSSYDWGKDDVVKLTPSFSQPNVFGEMVKGGYGGGIPVVAFWTRQVGEALGHVETIPITRPSRPRLPPTDA
jgi:hypothetical protein